MRAWSVLWKLIDPAGSSLRCSTRGENLGGRLFVTAASCVCVGYIIGATRDEFFEWYWFLAIGGLFLQEGWSHTRRAKEELYIHIVLLYLMVLADLQNLWTLLAGFT